MRINNLPLNLILITSGQVGFVAQGHFPEIWDCPEEGIQAFISPYVLIVNGREIPYNKAIRFEDYPGLKQWVQEQKMNNPF